MTLDAEELRRRIDAEYVAGGHKLGWRLLASPWKTVSGARVAFIGLNPGGSKLEVDYPELTPERGSAYVDEVWKSSPAGQAPLQKQVRALFKRLDVQPDNVLAGNLVPFRSRNWSMLDGREQALAFGVELWERLLSAGNPGLVVTMSGVVFQRLSKRYGIAASWERACWGNVKVYFGTGDGFRIVGLPHLSRYPTVEREASQGALKIAFPNWRGVEA